MMEALPDIIRRILKVRGVSDADLERFFNPSLRDLAKPGALPGVDAAAAIVLDAVRARGKIVVFGDYDCDGVSATAILVRTLRAFGADVAPFLPERLTEGYGMSDASVARLLAEHPGVSLVVTVDNGINSISQVAALKGKGVAVVVTDHHLPSRATGPDGAPGEMLLPDAEAIVNPKVAAPPELENLCGAGVAFLLANALVTGARAAGLYAGPSLAGPLLVLAGLATVTDVMPLLGQNRILVAEALHRFRALAPVGLLELHARASRAAALRYTSRDFGFILGPRINAAGRLASGTDALELVLTDDRESAREKARVVDNHNSDRKQVEQRMVDVALTQVVAGAAAQVIDLPGGHPGVAGIVAARVLERIADEPGGNGPVPVCVIVDGHGSARAPQGVNVRDALAASSEFLDKFGGHAAAAGFSVKEGRIGDFRARFTDVCARFAVESPVPSGPRVDAWVDPGDLTVELATWIVRLEPFGEGNPEPVFGLRNVNLRDVRTLGADGKHFACTVAGVKAIWWGRGELVETYHGAAANGCDVCFTLELSDYGGTHVELRIRSIKPPSQPCQ